MTDQNSKLSNSNGRGKRWQFWFLVSFSLFLVVTFGLYFPLWFRHAAVKHEGLAERPRGAVHLLREALYHEEAEVREGLVVNLNITPVPALIASPIRLDFFVNERPGNVPVPASLLELDHTKLMHVIGVRNDLNEFFHIHPMVTEKLGLLSIPHIFAKPGVYKIWSESKKGGVNHTFGHPEITVQGEGESYRKEVVIARSIIVGNFQVLLHYDEPITKGKEVELHFDIHDAAGREVDVEPYLAADMHLSTVRDNLKQLIHLHPIEHEVESGGHGFLPRLIHLANANGIEEHAASDDKTIAFRTVFAEAGLYKLFAQFRPKGIGLPPDEALLAEFWVRVEEKAPLAISQWWILLLISAVLIVLLSWGVSKFLAVRS